MFQSIQLTSLVILAAITTDIVFSAPIGPSTNDSTDSDLSIITQFIDNKYPLTEPIVLPDGSVKYRIAIISDLDGNSVSPDKSFTWISYFKKGYLTYNTATKNISIEWDSTNNGEQFKSHLSINGRGLELSELTTYNGNLITFDDKTGLVYIIGDNILIPWVMVVEGNGLKTDGNTFIIIHHNIHYYLSVKLCILPLCQINNINYLYDSNSKLSTHFAHFILIMKCTFYL